MDLLLVRFPARQLRLSVELPDSLIDVKPRVCVLRHPDYPQLGLDGDGDVDPNYENPWEVDSVMTEHEQANLVQMAPGKWTLNVEYPMVGFVYRIHWVARIRPDPWDVRRAGEAAELRRELLRQCATRLTSTASPVLLELEAGLDALLKYFRLRYGSKVRSDETMRLALYIYDDNARVLRRVAEAGVDAAQREAQFTIPLGEGVAYRAFRRSSFQLYLCPALTGGRSDGAYLYWPDDDAATSRVRGPSRVSSVTSSVGALVEHR